MDSGMFNGLFEGIFRIGIFLLIVIGVLSFFLIRGCVNDDGMIRTEKPLEPNKLEIEIVDGVPDTTYVYEIP